LVDVPTCPQWESSQFVNKYLLRAGVWIWTTNRCRQCIHYDWRNNIYNRRRSRLQYYCNPNLAQSQIFLDDWPVPFCPLSQNIWQQWRCFVNSGLVGAAAPVWTLRCTPLRRQDVGSSGVRRCLHRCRSFSVRGYWVKLDPSEPRYFDTLPSM
jgi:hypothetical protein